MTARSIICTPDNCGGAPPIEGTRLTWADVAFIFYYGGIRLQHFRETYSYLVVNDVTTCLSYCAKQACIADAPARFCHGCTLDDSATERAERADYQASGDASEVPEQLGFDEDVEEPVDVWVTSFKFLYQAL